jgi:hypothetical protein
MLKQDDTGVTGVVRTKERKRMNAKESVDWLNERDPIREWSVDADVFCLHCDGMFKAQDVACDSEGDPTCPVCRDSTPLDFHGIPWWREDLVDDKEEWRIKALEAEPGKPGCLPERLKARKRK